MPKSLIEQLPDIVKKGREQAERILQGLEGRQRVSLQTREVVLPAKDSAAQDWITRQRQAAQRAVFAPGHVERWHGLVSGNDHAAPDPDA